MAVEVHLVWHWISRFFLTVVFLAAPGTPVTKPPKTKPGAKAQAPAQAPKPSPVDEAKALQKAGKRDAALEVLRKANVDVKKAEGDESPQLLPVNTLAADILVDQDQLPMAESLIAKTLALHESLAQAGKVEGDSLGATLVVAARVDLAAKRFLAAVEKSAKGTPLLEKLEGPRSEGVARGSEILEKSADSLERLLGPADTMTSDARGKAADVFERLGRFDQAIAQRKGILASAIARGDEAGINEAANRLGRLMAMAGRAKEAVPLLESLPSSSTSTSRRRLLGELQLVAGHLLAADASFTAALEAEEAESKPSPAVIAADRLARLLTDIRRSKVHGTPEWFATTVTSLEKNSQPEGIRAMTTASEILVALGKPSDAIKPLTAATANARKQLSTASRGTPAARGKPPATSKPGSPEKPAAPVAKATTSPLVTDVVSRLAAVHLATGAPAAALEIAKPELDAAAETFGSGHGLTSLVRVMVAGGASGTDDHETAAAVASQALAFGLPRPSDAWEESLVAVYDRLGSTENHPDWRKDFVAARARQFGETHPHVATAWSLFGAARLAAGDWPAAVDCFAKARDIQRAALGEAHPELAGSLALLAHTQRAGGDAAAAARTAAEAVSILEKCVGLNHPATLEAADVLVAARLEAGVRDGVADLLERLCTADAMAAPVRRAYHLTRWAEVTVPVDKAAARTRVQDSMALPCWNPDVPLTTFEQRQLADTAAYAARVYRMLGDDAAAQTILLRARSIALRLDTTGSLIARIDRLATPGR